MAAQVDGGGALRVDTAQSNGVNGTTSTTDAQNRLLQVSASSAASDGKQQVQLRHKRTGR